MSVSLPDVPLCEVLVAWDATATRWGLSDQERGSVMPAGLDGPVSVPSSWRTDAAEHRIRLVVRIGELATELHSDPAKVRWWLRRPNRALKGLTVLEAMAESTSWMEMLVKSLEAAS